MTRYALAVLATLSAGCMTRFLTGPARHAVTAGQVAVRDGGCTIAAALFDCRSAPAVATYLGDYFKLNGLSPSGAPRDQTTATFRIFEDRRVVVIQVTLTTISGLIWQAEAQGDTLLRALVRLEGLLAGHASFRARLITHDDVMKVLKELGRQELSAEKTSFTYR